MRSPYNVSLSSLNAKFRSSSTSPPSLVCPFPVSCRITVPIKFFLSSREAGSVKVQQLGGVYSILLPSVQWVERGAREYSSIFSGQSVCSLHTYEQHCRVSCHHMWMLLRRSAHANPWRWYSSVRTKQNSKSRSHGFDVAQSCMKEEKEWIKKRYHRTARNRIPSYFLVLAYHCSWTRS